MLNTEKDLKVNIFRFHKIQHIICRTNRTNQTFFGQVTQTY